MASKTVWRTLQPRIPTPIRSQNAYRCFSCAVRHAQKEEQPSERTTSFGFETVAESIKQSKVSSVFTSVAPSYDTMNDLMSLTIHRHWKRQFVQLLDPGTPRGARPQTILDIAGGTGDIAFRLLDHATDLHADHASRVLVADINPAMLAAGRARAARSRYRDSGRLSFLEANAEDLRAAGVADASVDLYTTAFGPRNFTSLAAALREAYRVLKPGGVFAMLEFAKVGNPAFNRLYKMWSFGVIPLMGQVVAGDRESYAYLVESVERWKSQEEVAELVREAGFLVPGEKGWVDFTGGVVAVHRGVKP
ncbi:hypothetical protein FGG08_006237 [Glutinoglossum americanum]|uniref:2-methoxy-6-polyprenyl-1,4-benzoquinol methylase, mitochondrial n=1 Tax=Glutinoglossum americanum TaxID=1670608 RepID=A0A9P8I1Y8_9PEZI|nr:hypothetical protein FGG08_006237 [Glutinoglossum americanum]